ncbi:MAG TPA: ABC transporter permease subunit [Dehalococcoidia bacterium]|nr:ABC transporter permease subunit [Dehalococcoidia bacterium]
MTETWAGVAEFIGQLLGRGTELTPAFLDFVSWRDALWLSLDTIGMSVLAIGFAALAVLFTFLPAARNVAFGELSGSRSALGGVGFCFMRGVFVFTRGVPELLWAMLIVFVFSPGILPGAIALGLHNYGILGKLSAEVVEDLDPRPARALRTAGASNLQMPLYGVLPQVLPQSLSYTLYRWEVVIRTTIVVGFVAARGLGREFRLGMSFFQYDKVMLLLMCYLLLVLGVDLIPAWLRRLVR